MAGIRETTIAELRNHAKVFFDAVEKGGPSVCTVTVARSPTSFRSRSNAGLEKAA